MPAVVKPRPVVRIYREEDRSPWVWVVPLLALLLIGAGVAYLFLWPMGQGGEGSAKAYEMKIDALRQENETYRQEGEKLRRELATSRRTGLIDKEANKELQENLVQREKEILELNEELTFYKNLVSDEGVAPGVNVRGLTFSSLKKKPQQWRFNLVLTQVGAHKKIIKGVIELRVQGRQGDKSKALSWQDIKGKAKSKPKFGFQYFQKIEGEIILPEKFEPENVLVKVVPVGKHSSVQQSYSWNSILRGDGGHARKEKR